MAEEFVDLYQVLDLPVDADRDTVRKRINERYLDAQRNLDHRQFATRVKFQELFEVTLPQARYILLDDGRRDEYNRLVNAYRSPSASAPSAPPSPAPASGPSAGSFSQTTSGFSLEVEPAAPGGQAPPIEPLPQTPADPAQLAQERDELWKKWKSGLEAALTVEQGDQPKARGAVTSAPTSFSVATTPDSTFDSAPNSVLRSPPAVSKPPEMEVEPAPASPPPPKPAARPKVAISFDFGGEGEEDRPRRGDSAPAPGAEEIVAEHKRQHSEAEIEARRTEHRRQITKEVLVNVGLIWSAIGAALVIVPGVAALIAAVAHYYPRAAKPLLGYSSMVLWVGGFVIIGVAAFFAARELSKMMRRKTASQLSLLSYEELLKKPHRS